MNKLVYVAVVVVVLLIAGVVLLSNNTGKPAVVTPPTSAAQTSQQYTTLATTVAYTTVAANTTVNAYNTTTTVVASNSVSVNNTQSGCTANKYYSCSNLTFTSTMISATVGQDTGLNWSSFGIAYAPKGTPISNGVPSGITFYTTNVTSSSNVGTSLANGATVNVRIPVSNLNSTVGTLWECYTNSGLLYVGNGCIINAGGSGVASYVEIATVNG